MRWIIIFSVVFFLGCSQPFDSKEKLPKQEDEWYILADKEYGPVSLQELKNWCEQGRVLPDTLVRKGNGKYKIAKNFLELQEVLNKLPTQDIESIQIDEEMQLIPNITHGLQPEED
ncbi:MAG: DUF4339 domain-containing protein [bacterium]